MWSEITGKAELAKVLAVGPGEIDYVLSRLARYYRPQRLRKSDGNFRTLLVPQGKLKTLQTKVKEHVLDKLPWLACVHGGIKRRSIFSNARPHVDKTLVFSLDVQDFFPHVGPDRVFNIFVGLGFGDEASRILTSITTWRYQLPQGSPTSTGIANLSLVIVDSRIQRLASLHGFAYTRFVDDLTLSEDWRLLKFRNLIQRIIESEGFRVKPQKTLTMDRGTRQTVTKLVVNAKINICSERRDGLRKDVFGFLRTQGDSALTPSLLGRIHWLRYINPEVGERLLGRAMEGRHR